MGEKIKKNILIILMCIIIVSTVTVGNVHADGGKVPVNEISNNNEVSYIDNIETLYINDTNIYVYTPSNISPIGPTTPIILVYGNEDYTIDSVNTTIIDGDLDDIALEENAVIMFVNSKGDTWSNDDIVTYTTIFDYYSESTTSIKGKDADEKYIGSKQRTYIIAEGSGADFVSGNLVDDELKIDLGWMISYYSPTSVMLFNTSVVPSNAIRQEYPAVIVNGSDEVNNKYTELNDSGEHLIITTSEISNGFDFSIIKDNFDKVISTVRREPVGASNRLIFDIPNYNLLGIDESIITRTISTGKIEYYKYVPDSIDISKCDSVPLMLTFHGGGNHAQYQAWASEWPLIGKENNFIVISVNQHVEREASEIIELLDQIIAENPVIDTSRVYASGFSMGSVKSWQLGLEYSEYFAGIAPMDAAMKVDTKPNNIIIPTFYVAGEEDALPVYPHQNFGTGDGNENDIDYILNLLMEKNNIGSFSFDREKNSLWGTVFNDSYTINALKGISVVNVNTLKSSDGNIYTALVNTSNQTHEVLPDNSRAAWEFLSKFNRNADGSISIITKDNNINSNWEISTLIIILFIILGGSVIAFGILKYLRKKINNKK